MVERKFFFDSVRGAKLREELVRQARTREACEPHTAAKRARAIDGMKRCYAVAQIPWHGNVYWVASPRAASLVAAGSAQVIAGIDPIRLRPLAPVVRRIPKVRQPMDVRFWSGLRTLRTLAPRIAVRAVQCVIAAPALANVFLLLKHVCTKGLADPVIELCVITVLCLGFTLRLLEEPITDWLEARRRARQVSISHHFASRSIRAAIVEPLTNLLQREDREVVNFEVRRANNLDGLTAGVLWRTSHALDSGDEAFPRQLTEIVSRVCLGRLKPGPPLEMRVTDRLALGWECGYFSAEFDETAGIAWLERAGELQLDADLREKLHAYVEASSAGFWWPHHDFVIASDPPIEMHCEGDVERRLHRLDGPAARYADGDAIHACHGDLVHPGILTGSLSATTIDALHNGVDRRAALERMGWARYIVEANLPVIDQQPDPGNPPHLLTLHAAPRGYERAFRLLSMVNGSPDLDGTHRRFAEPVPATIDDAIEAAAWQFDCSVEGYKKLRRRT